MLAGLEAFLDKDFTSRCQLLKQVKKKPYAKKARREIRKQLDTLDKHRSSSSLLKSALVPHYCLLIANEPGTPTAKVVWNETIEKYIKAITDCEATKDKVRACTILIGIYFYKSDTINALRYTKMLQDLCDGLEVESANAVKGDLRICLRWWHASFSYQQSLAILDSLVSLPGYELAPTDKLIRLHCNLAMENLKQASDQFLILIDEMNFDDTVITEYYYRCVLAGCDLDSTRIKPLLQKRIKLNKNYNLLNYVLLDLFLSEGNNNMALLINKTKINPHWEAEGDFHLQECAFSALTLVYKLITGLSRYNPREQFVVDRVDIVYKSISSSAAYTITVKQENQYQQFLIIAFAYLKLTRTDMTSNQLPETLYPHLVAALNNLAEYINIYSASDTLILKAFIELLDVLLAIKAPSETLKLCDTLRRKLRVGMTLAKANKQLLQNYSRLLIDISRRVLWLKPINYYNDLNDLCNLIDASLFKFPYGYQQNKLHDLFMQYYGHRRHAQTCLLHYNHNERSLSTQTFQALQQEFTQPDITQYTLEALSNYGDQQYILYQIALANRKNKNFDVSYGKHFGNANWAYSLILSDPKTSVLVGMDTGLKMLQLTHYGLTGFVAVNSQKPVTVQTDEVRKIVYVALKHTKAILAHCTPNTVNYNKRVAKFCIDLIVALAQHDGYDDLFQLTSELSQTECIPLRYQLFACYSLAEKSYSQRKILGAIEGFNAFVAKVVDIDWYDRKYQKLHGHVLSNLFGMSRFCLGFGDRVCTTKFNRVLDALSKRLNQTVDDLQFFLQYLYALSFSFEGRNLESAAILHALATDKQWQGWACFSPKMNVYMLVLYVEVCGSAHRIFDLVDAKSLASIVNQTPEEIAAGGLLFEINLAFLKAIMFVEEANLDEAVLQLDYITENFDYPFISPGLKLYMLALKAQCYTVLSQGDIVAQTHLHIKNHYETLASDAKPMHQTVYYKSCRWLYLRYPSMRVNIQGKLNVLLEKPTAQTPKSQLGFSIYLMLSEPELSITKRAQVFSRMKLCNFRKGLPKLVSILLSQGDFFKETCHLIVNLQKMSLDLSSVHCTEHLVEPFQRLSKALVDIALEVLDDPKREWKNKFFVRNKLKALLPCPTETTTQSIYTQLSRQRQIFGPAHTIASPVSVVADESFSPSDITLGM